MNAESVRVTSDLGCPVALATFSTSSARFIGFPPYGNAHPNPQGRMITPGLRIDNRFGQQKRKISDRALFQMTLRSPLHVDRLCASARTGDD